MTNRVSFYTPKTRIYAKIASGNDRKISLLLQNIWSFRINIVPLQSTKMRIYAKIANRYDSTTSNLSQTTHRSPT